MVRNCNVTASWLRYCPVEMGAAPRDEVTFRMQVQARHVASVPFPAAASITAIASPGALRLAMRAAMAGHAILEVADPLPPMMSGDAVWLVFMAAVAGVAAGIIVHMAGRTGRIVIAVQLEETRMV